MSVTLLAAPGICPACYGPAPQPGHLCVTCSIACPYPPVDPEPTWVPNASGPRVSVRDRVITALALAGGPLTVAAVACAAQCGVMAARFRLGELVVEGRAVLDPTVRPWVWTAGAGSTGPGRPNDDKPDRTRPPNPPNPKPEDQ